MAGITLEIAQGMLDKYLAAETAVLTGQSYEIAGRKLSRANLAEITQGRDHWNSQVTQLSASARGRGRTRTMIVRG